MQIYLDDILILAVTRADLCTAIQGILDLLRDLGILFHPSKCELEPTTSIEYLGMQLDIPNHLFRLTDKQLTKLNTKVTHLLDIAKANRR